MKQDDIRPQRPPSARRKRINQDIAWLLAGKDTWIKVDCPACAEADHRHIFDENGFGRPPAERERGACPAETQHDAQGSGATGPACEVRP